MNDQEKIERIAEWMDRWIRDGEVIWCDAIAMAAHDYLTPAGAVAVLERLRKEGYDPSIGVTGHECWHINLWLESKQMWANTEEAEDFCTAVRDAAAVTLEGE